MDNSKKFYIDGDWVTPSTAETLEVVNPATEAELATIASGGVEDVDRAVAAAQRAFVGFSETSRAERMALLDRIIEIYRARSAELAVLVSQEMGAPLGLARQAHVPGGLAHFEIARDLLRDFEQEKVLGDTTIVYEPIGVCGLITPWNWPLNQTAAKLAPAIAAGCTTVLKPSEVAPLSAMVLAEILAEAGVPAGAFNLVNGEGPTVGAAMAAHPDIDMISFTGSTNAGVHVARNAAGTVKRVAQELGGKSANIVLDDADLDTVIARDVAAVFRNSGQSCNAASRMLVPRERISAAEKIAKDAAERLVVGSPADENVSIGPVASETQYRKVQEMLATAIAEGATVITGGVGRPFGLDRGYFVKPTVLSGVTPEMEIARDEIFGPVVTLTAYENDDDAIRIANDSDYGLSGRVSSADPDRARRVARRLRTGMVHINGAPISLHAPFGGYKRSGNGREYGLQGILEYLEIKSIFGDRP